jgi:hypothetical protein
LDDSHWGDIPKSKKLKILGLENMPFALQNTTQYFSCTSVMAINCHINFHEHQGHLSKSLKQTPMEMFTKNINGFCCIILPRIKAGLLATCN